MFNFAKQLFTSWVVNRGKVLWWYYTERFHLRKSPQPLAVSIAYPDQPNRPYSITWLTSDDARESMRMFSHRNPWLNYELPREARIILDLGANVGCSMLYFSMKYPNARIYAVEMVESNAHRCQELAQRNQVNAEVIQVAVAATDGVLQYQSHSSHTRCHLSEFNTDGKHSEGLTSVQTRSMRSLLNQLRLDQVDVLKIDIEGAESYLFQTIDEWAPAVSNMLVELHDNINYDDAVRTVTKAGFIVAQEDRQDRTEIFCRRQELNQ